MNCPQKRIPASRRKNVQGGNRRGSIRVYYGTNLLQALDGACGPFSKHSSTLADIAIDRVAVWQLIIVSLTLSFAGFVG